MIRIGPARSELYDANFSVVEWASGNGAEHLRQALAEVQKDSNDSPCSRYPMPLPKSKAPDLPMRRNELAEDYYGGILVSEECKTLHDAAPGA
ncbi:MAG: hypothetical protein RMK19_02365 [Bacteroidia bacterium]|nr:hypothetical protein [Bacteroidia bacterium]MDW8014840.1 hypothetical protein [Bacteroidia bacterium]